VTKFTQQISTNATSLV